MKLFSLLREAGIAPATKDTDISAVTYNAAAAGPGALFVCVPGAGQNGGALVAEAIRRGAAAVVCEETYAPAGVCRTANSRLAFSKLCAAFYGHPDRSLGLIGITGTNGKTTTAYYVRHLLEKTGRSCAVIGTLGADVGGGSVPTGYTTPTAETFFASLRQAADAKKDYCVCEVSSQALAQYRVAGARFTLGVMTNVGSDHLDYHKTQQRLVEAKCRLFQYSDSALVNGDDAYAEQFLSAAAGPAYTYSCRAVLCDYAAKNIRFVPGGAGYILFNGEALARVRVPAPGLFSVYNSLCAAAAVMRLGAPLAEVASHMETLPQVPGRAELIEKNGVRFYVDFAHTPQALYGILTALRPEKGARLITVFGCGGDRDRAKRPVMGDVAASLSDAVVVTTDNPRTEDPLAIINDIRAGVSRRNNVFFEPDRRAAIRLAYEKAAPGDTVLVAGKGHETEQLFSDGPVPFSDADEIRAL